MTKSNTFDLQEKKLGKRNKRKTTVAVIALGLAFVMHGQAEAETFTSNQDAAGVMSHLENSQPANQPLDTPNATNDSEMILEIEAEEIATNPHLQNIVKAQLTQPKAKAYSIDSLDLTGRKHSLYTGRYYDKSREQYRLCVAKRESTFTGSVRGGGGDRYTGFYQFSPELAQGAAWMMLPEAKAVGLEKEVRQLINTPMNKWPRYYQDWAFWRVLNHGEGTHHWAGGRYHCDSTPWAEKGW